MSSPRRGEIYWTVLDPAVGSEQRGTRPAVVVQNDVGNEHGRTTIVVPLTSNGKVARYPFGVGIPSGIMPRPSFANCGHVRNVDKSRLIGEPVARLDDSVMAEVDRGLRVALGLE